MIKIFALLSVINLKRDYSIEHYVFIKV